MAEASSQLLCGLGRPCPNFQRLIEYVEPVEVKDVATATLRIPASIQMAKFSTLRWKSRTSRLKISPNIYHRKPNFLNYSLSRRPKLMDIRSTTPWLGESSAEMTKKMNNQAETQQRNMELQSKPIVKINPNVKAYPSATVRAATTWM